jgi:tetratricopeptide (TPR) repeat protein
MRQGEAPAHDLLARGEAALRAGDRPRARELLSAAVRADPRSAQAWLWLAGALDDHAQQRECLERALALDPQNAAARRGLEAQEAGGRRQEAGGRWQVAGGRRQVAGGRWQVAAPARSLQHSAFSIQHSTFNIQHSALVTILLGALGGVGVALAWVASLRLGNELGPGAILALVLLVGPPLGWAALIIAGVLLRISGRWLGGLGGAGAVRAGLAWAAAPQAAGLLIWLAQLIAIPAASFGGGAAAPGQSLAAAICWGAHGLLALGSAYLAVAGVAAAHRISRWRAAAAWLLAALLCLGTLAAIFASSALLIWLRGG